MIIENYLQYCTIYAKIDKIYIKAKLNPVNFSLFLNSPNPATCETIKNPTPFHKFAQSAIHNSPYQNHMTRPQSILIFLPDGPRAA